MKVQQEDLDFAVFKNVENEAEVARFQIVLMFKNVVNEVKAGGF